MPLCEGRAGGPGISVPCPDDRRDNSVRHRQGDLFLCDACAEARFPTEHELHTDNVDYCEVDTDAVSEETESSVAGELRTSPLTTNGWVKSELLCFVADKSGVMTVDHIVDVCSKFYREDEILDARQALVDAGVRMLKRQGGNKLKSTVEDIVKTVLKPKVKLPEFHASQLSRLPPVDLKHCDTAAILVELHSLRSEVREFSKLQVEIAALRAETQRLSSLQNELSLIRAEVNELASIKFELPALRAKIQETANSQLELLSVRTEIHDLSKRQYKMHADLDDLIVLKTDLPTIRTEVRERNNMKTFGSEYPPLCTDISGTTNELGRTRTSSVDLCSAPTKLTAAEIVTAATNSGELDKLSAARRSTRPQKFVVGKRLHPKLQSARVLKHVNIFVTRLHPDTASDEISACVTDALLDVLKIKLPSGNVKCATLKTKFDSYASFSVTVMIEEDLKNDVIDLLMSGECWPEGVLVRKFYMNRNGGH